jgi:cytochrome c oxidase subunit II
MFNELLRKFLWLPPQASTIAAEMDWLHYLVILVTIAGSMIVPIIGAYFVIKYRRTGTGVVAPSPYAEEADEEPEGQSPLSPDTPGLPTGSIPLWAELIAIFSLLGLFVLFWVLGFRQFMKIRVPPEGSMEVYVTAKQWMWKFAYPEGGGSVGTLYVPTGRPVKLIMTSRDVIHSFFVPDFRVKMDVVPGRYTTLWFEVLNPGTYDIFCTEYCGTGHSTMRGQVVALAPEDYSRWLARGTTDEGGIAPQDYAEPAVVHDFAPKQELSLVELGQRAAGKYGCLRCHTIDGTPYIGPTWAGLYGSRIPLEGGGFAIADEAYLTESMMDPALKVHAGFKPVMPTYIGMLPPAETAAIVEYIRAISKVSPQPGADGQVDPFQQLVPAVAQPISPPAAPAMTQPATAPATLPGTQPATGPSTGPATAPATQGTTGPTGRQPVPGQTQPGGRPRTP